MRILYFYQYFTTPKGAWGTRVYEFARRWVRQGHAVTVVTSVYDKSDLKPTRLVERVQVEGIDVIVVNVRLSNKDSFVRRVLTFLAYSTIASWYALRLPADVVVASSGPITAAIPGIIARYLRAKPFVFEARDLWPEGAIQLGFLRRPAAIRAARAFEKLCYRAADSIVALSPGMEEWIAKVSGSPAKIHSVPNASDNELFAKVRGRLALPKWAHGKRLALYTGTLGFGDDCGQIVEMAARLTEPGDERIEVVFIGDGKARSELEEQAADCGARVRFLGLMPKEEVFGWLEHASCALCTTKPVAFYDTCSPNKIFDAFAAGAPVVQTTQGWLKALLAEEDCGLTTAPNDPDEMAAAVRLLAHDAERRQRLSRNASRIARQRFDRDLLASSMLQSLRTAVESRCAQTRASLAS